MKYFLFFVLFLAGCRGITPPPEFTVQTVQTHTFSLAAWSKLQAPGEPVKIYIEGDGRAFDIDGQPTSDPTPRGTMLREIAFGDTHPNVVYLGRPCQFVTNSACRQNIGPRRASPPKSLMRKPKPSNSLHKTVR